MSEAHPSWLLRRLRQAGKNLQGVPRALGVVLGLTWLGFIWFLSSQSVDSGSSSFLHGWIWNCGHAPLFGLIAFWSIVALPRENGWPKISGRAWGVILLLVLGYGVVDELHQSQTAGRVASALDVGTDLVGATCTLWLASYLGRSDATARGLHGRLAAGLFACGLFGLLATVGG